MAAERGPILDAQGRRRYIIELREAALAPYSTTTPPPFDGMPEYDRPEARHLVRAIAARHGLTPLTMYSHVGTGFAAFASPSTIGAVTNDPAVSQILEDFRVRKSGSVWTDTVDGMGRRTSWGTHSMGGSKVLPNQNATVYIIDSGVGFHIDLPSQLVQRFVVDSYAQYTVGCYPHATGVAGIIIGESNQAGAVMGAARGSMLMSYAVNSTPHASGSIPCSVSGDLASTVVASLNAVKADITARQKVGVINISMNDPEFRSSGYIGWRFPDIVTPVGAYKGALIVQSAGNTLPGGSGDACAVSYEKGALPAGYADGVVVVGGYDENGQQAVKLNNIPAYRNSPLASDADGSNHGACVELWGPSKTIYTAWAQNPQWGTITYSNRDYLSGTSFAAPYVTAMAAWLATAGPATPQDLEAAMKAYARQLGSVDKTEVRPITHVWPAGLPPTSVLAIPTVEWQVDGQINADITFPASHHFTFSYDSRGASYCHINGWVDTEGKPTANWMPPRQDLGIVGGTRAYPPGHTYIYRADCVAPNGMQNTAYTRITTTAPLSARAAVGAKWLLDGSDVSNSTTSLSARRHFTLRYVGEGVDRCDISSLKGETTGTLAYWYFVSDYANSYEWTDIALPTGRYRWRIDCRGDAGTSSSETEILITAPGS